MKLINADEMLKRLESWNTDDEMDKALYNFTLNRIIEQPTVDAEPVRNGHWVGIDDEPCEAWECDVCGYIYETDSQLHNYCPNCGAKMGEKE